jgi:hypothetical protein
LLGELELPVDDAGDAAFERVDGLAGGVALGAAPLIVGLAWTGQPQPGDGDAVQDGIQLAVATASSRWRSVVDRDLV